MIHQIKQQRYKAFNELKKLRGSRIGSLPASWTLSKVKYLADYLNGFAFKPTHWDSDGTPIIRIQNLSNQNNSEINRTQFSPPDKYKIRAGDILISWSATLDVYIWQGEEAWLNQHIFRVTVDTKKISKQYFYWVAKWFMGELNESSHGTTMQHLTADSFGGFEVPLPPLKDQLSISNFLDYETAKVDALIEKQQRLIELLKEKRQAVISHAVTKGLNPNAPMKDSGVEWLGEIPAHWIATRLKYLKGLEPNSFVDGPFGSNLKSEHFIDDGVVYVIESTFATTGQLDAAQLKKISLQHYETIKRSTTKGGDIIIAKIGARYGSSSILPELDSNAVVSGNSLKLTVNESLLTNEFANELLRVLKANDAMDDGVNITAQPALSLGGLNNLPFLRVQLSEQHEIVKFVKDQKEIFDGLIEKSALFIELSIERRTALISAAVTGKIDVRDWQAAA